MLFATLITVVVLLGLLTAVEIATFQNVQVQMRDEMAQIADSQMNNLRALPFSMISTCGNSCTFTYGARKVPSNLRGITQQYTLIKKITLSGDGNTADLNVRVRSWVYKNMSTAIDIHAVKAQ
jgi:hypothetical protein